MKRYRTRSLRRFLEIPGMEEKVFLLAARMLGYWKDYPHQLWEAYRALILRRPLETGEELIAFPSFTVVDGAYYPSFAIYCTDGMRKLNLDIPIFDGFRYEYGNGLLRDEAWNELVDMSAEERADLLEKSRVMPAPLPWEAVMDPMGILVSNPRVAAYIVASALSERWKKPFAFLPKILSPTRPDGEHTPEEVYEAVSRYLTLSMAAIRYDIDKTLEELCLQEEIEDDEDYDEEEEENEDA